MENEGEQMDRDSPAAKSPRLIDLSPTSGHLGNDNPDLSGNQLDGQVDEEEEKLGGKTSPNDSSDENAKISEKQREEFVESEKSKVPEPSVSDLSSSPERNIIYHVKWIGWTNSGSRRIGIMTQNENGPCPLLSIVNVLLLRGKLTLPEGCEVISAEQLLEFLGKFLSVFLFYLLS